MANHETCGGAAVIISAMPPFDRQRPMVHPCHEPKTRKEPLLAPWRARYPTSSREEATTILAIIDHENDDIGDPEDNNRAPA